MKVLVDVNGDAQDALKSNTTNLVGKCLPALPAQMCSILSAHIGYLLLVSVSVKEAGTEWEPCVSPVLPEGIRPLYTKGGQYSNRNRGGVNHL